VKSKPS